MIFVFLIVGFAVISSLHSIVPLGEALQDIYEEFKTDKEEDDYSDHGI